MSYNNQHSQYRDFTTGSISAQLTKLALPLMATSFVQMAYSLIDLAWVGRLGSESVAAVGAMGMLVWMLHSIALFSKISAEVSIGQSIGIKRFDKASIYASHTTTIAIILGVLFFIVFLTQPYLFVAFFKLSPAISLEAANYLRIISFSIPMIFLILNFSGIYVGSGRSDIPFYYNVTGLILNIVLDPLLIFGLGPFPALGSQGAALATCISQLVVLVLFIWHLKKRKGVFGDFPFFIVLKSSYTKKIFKLGFPVAAMNIFFSFINMNLVRIASIHGGHLGVTSQTTGGQIEGITWNTTQGFATALGSFVAQNYSAGRMDRAKKAFAFTLKIMLSVGIIISASFILYGANIFSIFIPERDAYMAGGDYLFVLGISQIFMMLELTTQGMFNGIGKTNPPAIISMTFNAVRIPLAMFLASSMGVNGVWWAITITTIFKGTILTLWFHLTQKKITNKTQ
ncbi:MAG: MATE family efflux transporter [Dysgonamonadaceae bacterium]|nr:MATE family efflux transporter [Dysgonamonadaceae bacterium]MDD4727614.1 MATE family efflux transporter [Dysgonamonadaceae bacterium]